MEPIYKKDVKLDKMQRKRQPNKIQVLQRQFQNFQPFQILLDDREIFQNNQNITVHFIDPQTQYYFELSRMKKAKQWWQYLDNTYFKPLNRKNILLTRDLTSAQKLINFFSLEGQLQSSYQEGEIYEHFPLLRQNTLIHVLFKSSTPFFMELITYSFANYNQCLSRRIFKPIKEQDQQVVTLDNYQIQSCVKKLKNLLAISEKSQQDIEQALKIGNLQLQAILQDEVSICKFEKTQQIKYKMQFNEDVDVQLQLWKHEAVQQNTQNSILWNNLISNHQQTIETQPQNHSSQVSKIKQTLMHYTILRYIEHGTQDKTPQMVQQLLDNMKQIKPAKTRQANNKKFFQTDCKICFCSFNSDSNQVLYCDMCNTSFHLACYGLNEVPQDKEYFCDRCTAIKKDEKTKNNIRKITCQICCKPNFPIKEIDGHYYHMTCLILFNFITIKQGRIQLGQGLSHQKILKKVIQSQIKCQACIFCLGGQGAELGMQFRCNVKGCISSMHPICAYINGCLFDVKRNNKEKRVQVSIRCNQHDCERDYIQQTYLRRYMCNFKNTSQKPLQSFRSEYKAESLPRKQKLESSHGPKSLMPKLIIDTKIIRKHISLRQHKHTQKTEEVQNTQIRKLLQRLQRPKSKV